MALAETALPATAITKNRRLVRTDGVVMAHGGEHADRACHRKETGSGNKAYCPG